jgi:molecular chaperone GrpE
MAEEKNENPDSENNAETTTATAGASNATADGGAEVEKWRNEYMYLRAEFENYKKNVIKERSDLRKYGSERLVIDLLATLDLLEVALTTTMTPENIELLRKGVELTAHELRTTLQRHGVEELPAQGLPFDPSVHEALSSEETSDTPEGHISRVFKKPYKLHDRVVRHGQVIVAKPRNGQ